MGLAVNNRGRFTHACEIFIHGHGQQFLDLDTACQCSSHVEFQIIPWTKQKPLHDHKLSTFHFAFSLCFLAGATHKYWYSIYL